MVPTATASDTSNLTPPAAHASPTARRPRERTVFELGRNRLTLAAAVQKNDAQEDRRRIVESFNRLNESFDLAEPFTRIREAIEEAQKAVK